MQVPFAKSRARGWASLAAGCLVLAAALQVDCAVDGPDVVKGSEANGRLLQAMLLKMYECQTPLAVDFIFIMPGVTGGGLSGFLDEGFYTTEDVDRCISDFQRLPCDQYRSTSSSDLVGPFFRLALAACPGVSQNSFFKRPVFQGELIRGSNAGSSSGSSSD